MATRFGFGSSTVLDTLSRRNPFNGSDSEYDYDPQQTAYMTEPQNMSKQLSNDQNQLAQLKSANDARIAALEAELRQLQASSKNDITDEDILDLELAANRARAYDMGGATTALSRMGSRAVNRETARLNELKAKQLKDAENQLKIGDLQDKFFTLFLITNELETLGSILCMCVIFGHHVCSIDSVVRFVNGSA